MISDQAEVRPLEVLGPNPAWVGFAVNDAIRDTLTQIALKQGIPAASVQFGDLAKMQSFMQSGIEPLVIILDLTLSPDLLNETSSLLNSIPLNSRVIVIGNDDHIAIYRELKHLGVTDYLIQPIDENNLQEAIAAASLAPVTRGISLTAAKNKPLTIILGTRGGVGASTLIVNLAWLTANQFNKKICLLDLDFYHGSVCIQLDLVPNAGLNDAMIETERLDETFLKRLLLQKEEKLSVLAGQVPLENEINFPGDPVTRLVTLLRNKYDFLFADLPAYLNTPFAQAFLNIADQVIIVTDFSLVSVQAVLQLKTFISKFVPNLKYKIIANNVFPDGGTVAKAMFEKAIDSTIDITLPYCKGNMLEGMNTGEPFVKMFPKHQYTKLLAKILHEIYPQLQPVQPPKKSLLKSLMGKNK